MPNQKTDMARENLVRLYGALSADPTITKDADENYVRGMFRIAVLRNNRNSYENNPKEEFFWDNPLVLSVDDDIIKMMEKMKKNDIVELEGSFVTKKVIKNVKCPACGQYNHIESRLCFVTPIFIAKRNKKDFTEYEAAADVQENKMISNSINIMGNLCNDVNYFKGNTIESAVYQIGTERKRVVSADDLSNRADFPVIRSFGKNAYMDNLCIHKGTLVEIDGYIHSKSYDRDCACEICGENFKWKDSTLEIVPYITEYLAGFTDPEDAKTQVQKENETEIESLKNRLRN